VGVASIELARVGRELARDESLAAASAAFGALAGRAAAATTDDEVRKLMAEKDRLLTTLPALARVPFGTFYTKSGVLHARLGHALRTTHHNEPDAVRNDLLGARRVTRELESAFRAAA
jgi:hypothetical protein